MPTFARNDEARNTSRPRFRHACSCRTTQRFWNTQRFWKNDGRPASPASLVDKPTLQVPKLVHTSARDEFLQEFARGELGRIHAQRRGLFLAFGHLFGGRNAFSLPLGHNAVFHMAFVKPLFARKRPWPSHGFACPERVFIFHGCRVWMLLVFKNRKKRKMHSRPARGSEKRRRILCSSMPTASTGGGPCPLHGLLLASSTHHSCPDCVRFFFCRSWYDVRARTAAAVSARSLSCSPPPLLFCLFSSRPRVGTLARSTSFLFQRFLCDPSDCRSEEG